MPADQIPAQRERQFFDTDGKRVCPHQAFEVGCWWVRSGNPHTADGYGCICLVPPHLYAPAAGEGS